MLRAAMQAYRSVLRPLLFALDAETAHDLGLAALRLAESLHLLRPLLAPPPAARPVTLMGLEFANRVGLAAGLDKSGANIDALGRLGFGFVEVGTITPRPQAGNPRPRLFRLVEHRALINRMGFNNPGIAAGVANVAGATRRHVPIGFNIGKNKDTPNERAAEDYLQCLQAAHGVADYITVNLSSPNTPGLRDLQGEQACARLLEQLVTARDALDRAAGRRVPLLFKVAPDLDEAHIQGLARVFRDGGLDGLIATNTTIDHGAVAGHRHAGQAGGLSGAPLHARATAVVAAFAAELHGALPIIGVGGIGAPADALRFRQAGAALVQLYSGLIYAGPALVAEVARALDEDRPAAP